MPVTLSSRRDFVRDLFRETAKRTGPMIGPTSALVAAATGASQSPTALPRAVAPARAATVRELRALACELGLEDHADAVVSVARYSVRLTVGQQQFAFFRRGQEAPAGETQPTRLLQTTIDGASGADLPAGSNLLSFGLDASGRATVTLDPDPREKASKAWPLGRSGEAHIQPALELTLPRPWSETVDGLLLDDPARQAWQPLRERLAADQGSDLPGEQDEALVVHRLLGYPDERRGDMPLACELAARGVQLGATPPRAHHEAARLQSACSRWQLLLQLSADDRLDWRWGDRGARLYVWIDRDDLSRGDVSRTQTVIQ